MPRLIIQAGFGHVKPIVATYTDPITKERKDGISITFARNRFNCFDSDESKYKNDPEALKKIKSEIDKINDRYPGTYRILTLAEYAQFGNTLVLTAIWAKIRHAALTKPDTLADVLATSEIEILKRFSEGSAIGYEAPDLTAPVGEDTEVTVSSLEGEAIDEPVKDQMRPKANRGAGSTKNQLKG